MSDAASLLEWWESLQRSKSMATERDETRGEAETAQPTVPGLAVEAQRAIREALTSDAFRDAVTEVIRAQAGLIPTAHEVAKAIREYDDTHGVPASADWIDGHPVDPADGLS